MHIPLLISKVPNFATSLMRIECKNVYVSNFCCYRCCFVVQNYKQFYYEKLFGSFSAIEREQ